MIAAKKSNRSACKESPTDTQPKADIHQKVDWHDRFLRLLPDIRRHAGMLLQRLTPRIREEAIDDVVAHALVSYLRLVELDKENLAYATPLAHYAVARYRAGRRVGLPTNSRDVLSQSCQRRNQFAIEGLNCFARCGGALQDILVEDKRFTPADTAALRIDFQAWLESLSKRNRQLAEQLAMGETTCTVARLFGLSSGRVSQLRRELREAWYSFQSEFSKLPCETF